MDKFLDPFEGSVPKKQIDDQLPLFSSRNAIQMMGVAAHYPSMSFTTRRNFDPWREMTLRRQAKIRSAYASCWTVGPESEGMWRLYCDDDGVKGRGVALRSTLGKAEASVYRHDLVISPIRYRYYHEGEAFNDELDPFMHKRMGFAHENEVRLLKYDESHYFRLADALTSDDPDKVPPPELADYVFLDCSPVDVIEAITIGPYADEAYENKARESIESTEPSLADRVELSVLSERRYAPQF